ncbi:flagellar hook assembly protein FlgD [Symbioplanes lichenis]|uniref:flagellar hook assembly protein FlgD n=1 Tax=Symbioplanes lichenis TaxID=1629072 RepID=UPI0027382BDF|nr:flagellar hook capping FlgD N-terminal domain-containing protein [Actinoplanes lichenis]
MTSPINGFVSNTYDNKAAKATSTYTNGTTTNAGASKSVADQDTFLKLLVAQLKYQDPSNPADSTQFLAQTAQFTQVEKLGQIAEMMQAQQLIGASALVGRTVTYQDAEGNSQTGVVTRTKLNGDSEPTLVVGNMDVQLSKVTEVQQAGTAQSAATATPAAATPAAPATPAAAAPAAPAAAPAAAAPAAAAPGKAPEAAGDTAGETENTASDDPATPKEI